MTLTHLDNRPPGTADEIETLRASVAALTAERDAAKHRATAGWALATHWQDRYLERAKAHDAAIKERATK